MAMRDANVQQQKPTAPPSGNAYCARLDLPIPRVEQVAAKPGAKLFHLMVVTLLERGESMPLEAVAERLKAAGVASASGDMATSLLKSWHGAQPVFRDDEGRFALDLTAWELKSLIFRLGLRPAVEPKIDWQPKLESISDEVPLTEEEVRAAFAMASSVNISNVRRVAAVLDVRDEPMSVADVEACVDAWASSAFPVDLADLRRWTKSCVIVSESGYLQIDRRSPHLSAMRRALRKLALPQLRQAAVDEQVRRHRQAWASREAERLERDRRIAERLRRAVLRVVPENGPAAAAALLDVGDRVVRSFIGSELFELPAVLEDYDLIAALWVRDTFYALGIRDHDRWRLVDLKPPQKTRQLNRAGRKLTITPQLLISSSTGISRPLGDTAKVAEYLTGDKQTKLRRRLESDVKALFAFYNYGLLHGQVRLRWGFLNEWLGVEWAQPGDPTLHSVLEKCRDSGTPVDIVAGSAPGWKEPWARAVRVRVVSFDYAMVTVQGTEQWTIPRDEIQAIRIIPQTELDR
jgi:hypothetical protein